MPVIDASHLSHARLQALRHADSLPLSTLCKQVQRENYRAWQAWERAQEYASVMQGRYHTTVEADTFTLTCDDHVAPVTAPLRDYWTLALGQRPRTRKDPDPMDVLKLSISKNALIERKTLEDLLTDTEASILPMARGMADNVRLALAYRLKDFRNFEHNGAQCKVLAVPTRGSKGLDIWIHVQRRSTDTVQYSPEPVCQISGNGGTQPVQVTISDYSYHDLLHAIGSGASLEAFGEQHYFESDIRKLAQSLLEASCLPLWPGILLALTPDAVQAIKAVERLLGALDAGLGTVSLLSLDHTPANRQALAQELAQGFGEALGKLQEQLGYDAPMVEKIQAKYDALAVKIALAESVLGVEIDCLDAQADVELALAAA